MKQPQKKPFIGGQAIIEGVLMKGPKCIATAARRPNGKIVVETTRYSSVTRFFPLGLPLLRGIVFLFEMLVIGIKALTWSANQQMEKKETHSGGELVGTLFISFALAIGLFLGLPYIAAWLLVGHVPSTFMFNLIDGIVRALIFLAYIIVIGLAKDVKRLYQYHGAEHMAVNCFEAGLPLTVQNVRKFSTIHPRCGTSLLVYVIGLSIIVFSVVHTQVWYYNVLLRIIVVPLIGGIGYELLRLSARFRRNPVLWLLTLPGKWTQRITTRTPDASQVEVAIVALKKAL